jgi:xanthine dehydrogenase molybdopterin-binding subunit B
MAGTARYNSMNNNIGNIDAANHVTGKSIYVDDIPVMEGTLYIKVFDSTVAHGIIKSIDFSAAEQMPGIVKIFSLQRCARRKPDWRHHS